MKIIQINTMQNYKYQLSAPSSTETLISTLKGLYLFEPKVSWGREKLSQREEENKQKHVKKCNRPGRSHRGRSRPAYDPFRCALWPGWGCVRMGWGWGGEQGIIRAEWWVVAMSDDCRVELRHRTDTAFINARRPSHCRQQHQCNNCVSVFSWGGGERHRWYESPC